MNGLVVLACFGIFLCGIVVGWCVGHQHGWRDARSLHQPTWLREKQR